MATDPILLQIHQLTQSYRHKMLLNNSYLLKHYIILVYILIVLKDSK